MYQLACAVKHIHSAGIVHTDLKPSHVLIDSECQIAVTGFDNTRTDSESIEAKLHDGFVNYWYRSPERLLGMSTFTTQLDVWALGCVFAEIILGKPLFYGTSCMGQLE